LSIEHDGFKALIKKRVSFNFSKVSLRLDLCESLFSSFSVDLGTKALLNSLRKDEAIDYSRILDLGCGYGPIGLFFKAQDPSREVHMVDRDALAVDFALHNAALNRLDVSAYPSLDYEQAGGNFSLIATNFPAKLAPKGLTAFVYGASNHLSDNGVLAVVVVRGLAGKLDNILDNSMMRVLYREDKKGYCIRHIAFNEKCPSSANKYERHKMELNLTTTYTVKTAYGLPEFDTLGYGTQCLLSVLEGMNGYVSVFVLEPGQGHVAIAVMDLLKPKELVLASRDLLSLTFARQNVADNFGFEPRTMHVSYLKNPPEQELTVWNVSHKKDFEPNAQNLEILLKSGKPMLVYGERSALRALLAKKSMTVLKEVAQKNYCALLVEPKR
jgi:16S rRNA (guanine1207-N2)-methyltransferase